MPYAPTKATSRSMAASKPLRGPSARPRCALPLQGSVPCARKHRQAQREAPVEQHQPDELDAAAIEYLEGRGMKVTKPRDPP